MQKKFLIPLVVLGVLFVASVATAGYFYFQLQSAKNQPAPDLQAEAEALIAEVGTHIVLPSGEQPTIATVNDLEKLKDQPFFANAQLGFKVLIYTAAKKAFLYDPSAKKIVEVAPLNTETPPPETSPETPPEASPE